MTIINRWLRRVLPGSWLLTAIFMALLPQICIAIVEFMESMPITFPIRTHACDFITCSLLLLYGIYRILAFHPAFRADYQNWLDQTPWKSDLPLPLGPLHLVWQDVLIIGIFAGIILTFGEISALHAIGIFLVTYGFLMMMSMFNTNAVPYAYGMFFALGLIVLAWHEAIPLALTLAGWYALAFFGLRRSLAQFSNWSPERLQQNAEFFNLKRDLWNFENSSKSELLGWPFDQLKPRVDGKKPDVFLSALNSALDSWLCFAFLAQLAMNSEFIEDYRLIHVLLIGPLAIALAVGRTSRYVVGYAPPYQFWGRIMSGNWIIPGYDMIFLGPLTVMLTAGAAIYGLVYLSWPPLIVTPLALGFILFESAAFPPSLLRWQLTGYHRITPAALRKQSELQQTQ